MNFPLRLAATKGRAAQNNPNHIILMKKFIPKLTTLLILTASVLTARAGTVFYAPIPDTQSDAGSGISSDNQYTSAVDGGATRENGRIINGITLFPMAADGQTASADNCTLNALSGSFSNGGGGRNIQADGVIKEALSDVTFNNGASDNSQQEIVLDPESLEPGTTYDLRIYVCNSSGQNRQINLSFAGDGQDPVDTGWFNEDDARTSAGGFKDQNQAYYINYRFTWDGETTPGVTINQKSGAAPFVLYALTNQVVPGGAAGVAEAGAGASAPAPAEAAAETGEGGGEGMQLGFVGEESDQVGVSNDDFYSSDSLNSHGRWVELSKWGKCWQPTDVAAGWRPYTNGSFKNCDDCGWTFVSDEPWAWAAYHYGRWAKVDFGCGWVWVPGKTWAGSWVSWRKGHTDKCECVGWAPLPPEVGCNVDVGVSSWVDETYDIGPDCYTFVNVGDFGSDSYAGCNCVWDTARNSTIIIDTFNCTNISLTRWGTFCGGVDVNWCNTEIRKRGGKECGTIIVDRWDNPNQLGGKYARLQGNRLGLVSPRIKNEPNPKHPPKIVDRFGTDKIDHGWKGVKDPKVRDQVKNHYAQESKGKTPKNTRAQVPNGVADKMKQHRAAMGGAAAARPGAGQHPGTKKAGAQGAGALAGQQGGGAAQHPGGKNKAKVGAATGAAQTGGGFDQHAGGKNKMKAAGQTTGTGGASRAAGGFDQHPGKARQGSTAGLATHDVKKLGKGQAQGAHGATGAPGGGIAQHPGQKQKRAGGQPAASSLGGAESKPGAAGSGQIAGGDRRKKSTTQTGRTTGGAGGGAGQAQGASGAADQAKAAKAGAGRLAGGEGQTQAQGSGQVAGSKASGGKQKHQKQQVRQAKAGQSATGGGGGGGQGRTQQQAQQQQPQQLPQAQTSGQSTGGGGGGQARHTRKQGHQQQQAQQQQHAEQQQLARQQQQVQQQKVAQQQQQGQQQKIAQQQQLRQQQLAQQQQLARQQQLAQQQARQRQAAQVQQQQQQQRGKKPYRTPVPGGF